MQKMKEENVESLNKVKLLNNNKIKGKWNMLFIILCIIGFTLEATNLVLSAQCHNGDVKFSKINNTYKDADRELRVMTDISEGVENYTTTTTYSSEMCTERREFQLDVGEKRVNVCTYKGTVRVDVREFLNDVATIRGLYFTWNEFVALESLLPSIRKEMMTQLNL